uniref:Uncharacterized protein n=1 Tax=Panstrongylus lignarius TaxID=156445 RepID=A0A224Y518_9HEMI
MNPFTISKLCQFSVVLIICFLLGYFSISVGNILSVHFLYKILNASLIYFVTYRSFTMFKSCQRLIAFIVVFGIMG